MTFNPTAAQAQAIDDRHQNILVSASAGSGKTAVLVNRVIKLIKEGQSIDRMLLVTFTDAAAKNMRDKIREELGKIAQDSSQPKQLRDRMKGQINRLAAADISTIHAFCLRLIKRYYYLIDLDPQFRLLTDDTERLLLEEEVWHDVSEQFYAAPDDITPGQASFRQLVLTFASDRDDQGLDDLILRLYDVANAQSNPQAWLKRLPQNYDLTGTDILATPFYQQQLRPVVTEKLQQLCKDLDELVARAEQVDGLEKDRATLENDRAALVGLIDRLAGKQAGDPAKTVQQVKFGNFRGKPKEEAALAIYNDLKDQRNALKKDWTRVVKDYLGNHDDNQLCQEVEKLQGRFADLATTAGNHGLATSQKVLEDDCQQLQVVSDLFMPPTWNTVRTAFTNLVFARMPNKPKEETGAQEDHEIIKNDRDRIKKLFASITAKFFADDEDRLRTSSRHAQELLTKLSAVTIAFADRYQQTKLNRHVLEFSDLEHYAYQILTPPADNPDWQELIADLQQHYQEIMIDEYQDTNQLQESILMKLTPKGAHNLFMVGDVKQSIYRFREADPTLFLDKYQRYQQEDGAEAIVLGENFRSMSNITSFTNLLFTQLMDKEVGEIDYDQDAELKYAAKYYEENAANQVRPTEILLYDANASTEGTHEDDKLAGELRMVGAKIKELVAGHQQVYHPDDGQMHDIKYGDIVLLERTKGINNTLMEEFGKLDIPLTVHDVESYFQTTEVRVIISLLKVIDNPHQDIPLVAVLRSPLVKLSNQELAFIRLQNRSADYYTALKTFLSNYCHDRQMRPYGRAKELLSAVEQAALNKKLVKFTRQVNTFRHTAQQQTLVDLIWQIYNETGYLDYVGAMEGGPQRQANLHALYQRAQTYEESSFKGLYQFIRFIEKMQEHEKDLGVAPTQLTADTINVMTIHGSKGLQFPIVFLIDATHGFNHQASREKAVIDAKSGVGVKWMDDDRVVYDTPQRQIALENIARGERAEDLRVLYVALTRAEQRLFITGSFNEELKNKSLASSWQQWQKAYQSSQQVLSPQVRIGAQSLMDWVGLALTRYADQANGFTSANLQVGQTKLVDSPLASAAGKTSPAPFIAHAVDATMVDRVLQMVGKPLADKQAVTAQNSAVGKNDEVNIVNVLNCRYPHQAATTTTAYQSVTDVKQVFEDDDPRMGRVDYQDGVQSSSKRRSGVYIDPDFAVPNFINQDNSQPLATQVGTATHLVFQKLPLTKPVNEQVVHQTLDQLVNQGLVTLPVAAQVDITGICHFFKTAVGQLVLAHPSDYHREEPFSLIMNGHEPFADIQEVDHDQVLIHGIIDGYLETSKGITLVDYKTDHVNSHDPRAVEKIVQRYSGQLRLYAEALNIMRLNPVVQMGLYLVELKEFISIQGGGRKSGNH